MKGSTHLAIGAAIGTGAALYFPFHPTHAAIYMSVAAFSALAADLDGASLLTGKLDKLSRWLRGFVISSGLFLLIGNAYFYFFRDQISPIYSVIAVILLLTGFATSQGMARNTLVSFIGAGILYAGVHSKQVWLMELGAFVIWAPWLKHRGMTHTVWALLLWGKIGWGLEKQLNLEGITATAVAGYASHLLADTLTPNGVKWLFPLYKKSFKWKR